MKITHFKFALIALLALAAICAIAGYPVVSPEILASIGVMPMMIGETSFAEITRMIEDQGRAAAEFRAKQIARIDALSDSKQMIEDFMAKMTAPGAGSTGTTEVPPETYYDIKTKKVVPVLNHAQSLKSLEGKQGTMPSVGRLLRGIVLGGRADDANILAEERKALAINSDPSGGYTVAGALSAEWIDLLRANMVLSKAGCRTIPMDTGTLALARVVDAPTISWHAENAALGTGDPTFGAINMKARTVVCLVRLSLELSQDSANIEQMLQSTITNAMSGAIDKAGLVGMTTDALAAPSGIMNLTGRNTVTSVGAPTSWDFLVDGMYELLADNVPADQIGAFIAHPALWKKMAKLKTGITNDKTPLEAPTEVAAIPKLWTTAAPLTSGTTADGIIANWRDLIFGVRKDINVRVLSEAFMGSNLQVAVLAYARVDFAATRVQSFCTLEGITV